jgi:Rieske 2Fe-2S family protein
VLLSLKDAGTMVDFERIENLLRARKPRHSLAQAFYTDPDIYKFDLEAVFYRAWLMVGFTVELPSVGSYLALTVGRSPIMVVRDRDGVIRAYHNSCRHRGAQILPDGCGSRKILTCPYHQWSYGLDGALIGAARMPADFVKAENGLAPIAVEIVAGVIYVCLGDDPPAFDGFRADLTALLTPHRLEEAKLVATIDVVEKANWKLVMENARECYHCVVKHPDLRASFPMSFKGNFDFGEDRLFERFKARMDGLGLEIGPRNGDWWQVARIPLNEGCVSISADGGSLCRVPLCAAGAGDVGSLRWATEPHNFCHAPGDHVLMFSAYPTGPEETLVQLKWLVHKDAAEGVDYQRDQLIDIWNRTNLQDRDLAENNQRGVNGRAYRPGRYSDDAEADVMHFVDWYCATAERFVAAHSS